MEKSNSLKESVFISSVPIIKALVFIILLISVGDILINKSPVTNYFLAVSFWSALLMVLYKIRPRLIISSKNININGFIGRQIINIDNPLNVSVKNVYKKSLTYSPRFLNYFYYVPNLIFTDRANKQIVGKLDLGLFIWSPRDLKALSVTIEKSGLPIVIDHSFNKWLENGHNSFLPIVNKDKYPNLDSEGLRRQIKTEPFYRATDLNSLLKQQIKLIGIRFIMILFLGLIAIIWLSTRSK